MFIHPNTFIIDSPLINEEEEEEEEEKHLVSSVIITVLPLN
jgi:hypothetical protein